MPLIDDRGRLFGRMNLIDAIVAIVGLGLIPLAYGAFLMFREPVPKITTITPTQIAENEEASLEITGEDLRPFLTASVGPFAARGFLVQSPTRGEVKLPALPAGTYDVTLTDEGRVLVSMPAAVTVVAPPPPGLTTEVQALGAFVGLNPADAKAMAVGSTFEPQKGAPPVAEVLAVRPPEPATQRLKVGANAFFRVPLTGELRVPAIIRLHCVLVEGECRIGDTAVAQDATIVLPASAGSGQIRFTIDEVRPADARVSFPPVRSAIAMVRVRFVGEPEVLNVIKAGDVDVVGSGVVAEADRAVLTQVGTDRRTMAAVTTNENVALRHLQLQQPVLAFTGTVRIPVVSTAAGWSYKGRPVKVGAAFSFETTSGAMTGSIIDVKIESTK